MRKIVIGNNVYIEINNSIIEIDAIEIQGSINASFNFTLTRDGTVLKTVEFPLVEQELLAGDFLDENGIHRPSSGETIPYTEGQLIAFQDMTNLRVAKGGFYVQLSNANAILKLHYYAQDEEDKQIYVLNKNEELITVFNVDDEDPIFNPRIRETQNAEAVFTFSISPNNPKWKEINNPENLYVVDGKVFSTNFEGCFQEFIAESNEDYIAVTAYERQKLLSRKYVRAWNSETGFEKIDTFMVVILSGGELDLRNNDTYITTPHLKGTSGYVLDALLYGTGWTTGTCEVEGTFDFETDQVDIYENILKVQQIWGGILVFDSYNKIVHHRDETKWLPYEGYEVKYQKNMQSLDKLYNNKIITKLCPLGESGLNIKSVNNGSEWLTNYSYTDTELEGIENNPDIVDAEQLKKWGERKLKDLCKPRKELTVQAILLYQVEGYEFDRIGLNDVVDVINYANVSGDIEQLRVVGYDYGVWDSSDAIVDLSDVTLESTDIFKQTVSASNSINNGTLNSKKVVNFFQNGQSVSSSMQQIDQIITETRTDLYKSDDGLFARVKETETGINSLNDTIAQQNTIISNLKLTIEGLQAQLIKAGGSNLIRNSVAAFGNEYWEGTIEQYIDTDVRSNNQSKSSIRLNSGSIMQKVSNIKNDVYNISFRYKRLVDLATLKVKIDRTEYTLDAAKGVWTEFERTITITDSNFDITFTSDTNAACLISDLILIIGEKKQYWSQNANETNTDTVKIGEGIRVDSSKTDTYTTIDSDGNRTFNKNTNVRVAEMTRNGVYANELDVNGKAEINILLIQEIDSQSWLTGLGG